VPPKLYDPSKEKELTELEKQYAELEQLTSPVNFELEQELENAMKEMRRSIQKSKHEQKKYNEMYAQKRQEGQELLEAAKAELEELFKTQEAAKFLKCKSRVESTRQQLYNYNKLFENCRYTANLILGYIQKKLLQANPGEKTLIDAALRRVKKKISQSVIEQLGKLKFDFQEYVGKVWYLRDQAEDEGNLLKKLKHCQTENQITTAGLGESRHTGKYVSQDCIGYYFAG